MFVMDSEESFDDLIQGRTQSFNYFFFLKWFSVVT